MGSRMAENNKGLRDAKQFNKNFDNKRWYKKIVFKLGLRGIKNALGE